jgi:hypothetical protein
MNSDNTELLLDVQSDSLIIDHYIKWYCIGITFMGLFFLGLVAMIYFIS